MYIRGVISPNTSKEGIWMLLHSTKKKKENKRERKKERKRNRKKDTTDWRMHACYIYKPLV